MKSGEYGAWASIVTAFLAGIAVAGSINVQALILFSGSILFFLVRMPLISVCRSFFSSKDSKGIIGKQALWAAIYSAAGAAAFSIVIFFYDLDRVFIFLSISFLIFSYNIYSAYTKGTRAKESSISGVLGVSLLASFTYYAATGHFDKTAAIIWILVFLYLAGGIFYVEARLGVFSWNACFIFYLAAVTITGALTLLRLVPLYTLAIYFPSIIKAGMASSSGVSAAAPKRLGRIELVHSVIFVMLLNLAYHII